MFTPRGFVSVSEVNPLIICSEAQIDILNNFRVTFPQLWSEVLISATIKTFHINRRFCTITFLSRNNPDEVPTEIHSNEFLFSANMKFNFNHDVQTTFTDDHHTLENIHVVVCH